LKIIAIISHKDLSKAHGLTDYLQKTHTAGAY